MCSLPGLHYGQAGGLEDPPIFRTGSSGVWTATLRTSIPGIGHRIFLPEDGHRRGGGIVAFDSPSLLNGGGGETSKGAASSGCITAEREGGIAPSCSMRRVGEFV